MTIEFVAQSNDHSTDAQHTNKIAIHVHTLQSGTEACKQLFLNAMQEFADSENFKVATHQLYNELVIKINHSVNLAMPR